MTEQRKYEIAKMEAQEWRTRLAKDADDATLTEAFLDWLEAADENGEAWGELERLAAFAEHMHTRQQSGLISGKTSANPEPHVTSPRQSHGLGYFNRYMGALAAVFVLIAYLVYPSAYLLAIADFKTGTGETRQITLDDGSKIHLAAESAIAVSYDQSQRQIRLITGAALFKVTKDVRSFHVKSGDVITKVTGTEFEVRDLDSSVTVSVLEGSVNLSRNSDIAGAGVALSAGQATRVLVDEDRATEITSFDPNSTASWRTGKLVVDGWQVGETISVLSDYYEG
ncbi:MAG: FecR domain-containing protein, partial [Pseudomonadota bacterium]